MKLSDKELPQSLAQYLDENLIIPSREQFSWWANALSVNTGTLYTAIRGRSSTLTLPILLSFSNFLKIPPLEMIRTQNAFLLERCLTDTLTEKNGPLKRIEKKIGQKSHLVRDILVNDFLRPMNISNRQLVAQMRILEHTHSKFFHLQHGHQSYDFLCRLGEALGTRGKFWLDLQTKHDLDSFLEKNPDQRRYFDWNPPKNFTSSYPPVVDNPPRPGKIILEEYIEPSKIALSDWADFFCTNQINFERLLDGRKLMDFQFISLLAKAFDKSTSYWINLQNNYLENKYLNEKSGSVKITPIKPTKSKKRVTKLGRILLDEYIRPLNISVKYFELYIGTRENGGFNLIKGKQRVGVKMAVKLSQALGKTPMYWLDLQAMIDIEKGLDNNIERSNGRQIVRHVGAKPKTKLHKLEDPAQRQSAKTNSLTKPKFVNA